MDILEILETAASAIEALLTSERELFAVDVNERSLTARLALHLQRGFPDWHVDCEYNRLGDGIKRLPQPEGTNTGDRQGRTIFPDIVVHRRGERSNLLVIEVKKHDNDDVERDVEKLRGLTSLDGEYSYRCGIHLIFDCSRGEVSNVMVYAAGRIDRASSLWLKLRLSGPEARAVLDKAQAEFLRRHRERKE